MNLTEKQKEAARKNDDISFKRPMKAKLTHDYFSDSNWIYERKLDGVRCVVLKKNRQVKLYSRNEKNMNPAYPELVESLAKQPLKQMMADGEIVAFDGNVTSFSRLQNRMKINDPEEARKSDVKVFLYLFDLLQIGDYDLTEMPLLERKKILRKNFDFSDDQVRFLNHRVEQGEKYHQEACRKGWEGVIAKRSDSCYKSTRSSDWLKFKCVQDQELVIVGYTDPGGSRIGFGAIMVGFYQDGELRYAGKVGTGFDDETLKELKEKFRSLEQAKKPVQEEVKEKHPHWLKPKLVAEIGFTEWTSDNKLRHPRYKGLRYDKNPKKVIKES